MIAPGLHRRPVRQSITYRRSTAQEMRNSLAAYKRGVGDVGDGLGCGQGARLLKLAEQVCVLLDKEGYSEHSRDVFQALRPLYEEVKARRERGQA